MDTPCRSDKETHSAAEQVVRRAPFAPSPCSRGVASETGGRGGLVPRKAFSFGNLSEARRSTGELGEARANRRRAGRSQGESPESWAKPGEAWKLGKARRSRAAGQSRANRRRAGRSQAQHRRAGRSQGESPELGEARAKPRRARRIAGELGEARAKPRRARRSTAGLQQPLPSQGEDVCKES